LSEASHAADTARQRSEFQTRPSTTGGRAN
jgi:hypothetical protein